MNDKMAKGKGKGKGKGKNTPPKKPPKTHLEKTIITTQPISPYTIPKEILTYVPDENVLRISLDDGTVERKIFWNSEMSEEECDHLDRLLGLAKKENFECSPFVLSSFFQTLATEDNEVEVALKYVFFLLYNTVDIL